MDYTKLNQRLEKAVERLSIKGYNQFSDCFNNFLDLQLSFFCNNPDDRQKALYDHMKNNAEFGANFKEAMLAYGDAAEDYHDPMGDMFMSRISHGQHGQFFTPECISLLMAQIVGMEDGATVNDPTSGSGRMLLMALKSARAEGKEIKLFANDLSLTCAKMCLLNFCVNSVEGEVTCGDSLRLDYENFKFFKIDKLKNLNTGMVFSTYWQYTLDTAKEVEAKRNEWWLDIAKHGWMKYYHIRKAVVDEPQTEIEPLKTEIVVDKNGQISLF